MKIPEFIEDVKKLDEKFSKNSNGVALSEAMIADMNIWSNEACLGYLMMATKALELNEELVSSLRREMRAVFSEVTVDEAQEYYCNN